MTQMVGALLKPAQIIFPRPLGLKFKPLVPLPSLRSGRDPVGEKSSILEAMGSYQHMVKVAFII